MKYQVALPKPSAKRMKKGKVVILLGSGWEIYAPEIQEITTDQTSFDFEIADDFEYIYTTRISDGDTFNIYVEYSNDTGSRTEKFYLVPMKVI